MDQLLLYLSVLTIILLVVLIFRTRNRPQQPSEVSIASQSAPIAEGISPEVVAAITAAVAVLMEGRQGFAVKHIKRINNAPTWNRAGREEQVYSRL